MKSVRTWFNISALVRVDTFGAMLVYFPLLRNGIILSAHEKFDAPDYKRKEYVHPPPPHLRRVIKDYEIPPSETRGNGMLLQRSLTEEV